MDRLADERPDGRPQHDGEGGRQLGDARAMAVTLGGSGATAGVFDINGIKLEPLGLDLRHGQLPEQRRTWPPFTQVIVGADNANATFSGAFLRPPPAAQPTNMTIRKIGTGNWTLNGGNGVAEHEHGDRHLHHSARHGDAGRLERGDRAAHLPEHLRRHERHAGDRQHGGQPRAGRLAAGATVTHPRRHARTSLPRRRAARRRRSPAEHGLGRRRGEPQRGRQRRLGLCPQRQPRCRRATAIRSC